MKTFLTLSIVLCAGALVLHPQALTTLTTGLGLKGKGTTTSPLQIDAAAVGARISAAGTLDFPNMEPGSCAEQTIALTGALPGDEVFLGAPPDVPQGFLWNGFVSAANTVTVRMCKITAGPSDPPARAWRATIVRSF